MAENFGRQFEMPPARKRTPAPKPEPEGNTSQKGKNQPAKGKKPAKKPASGRSNTTPVYDRSEKRPVKGRDIQSRALKNKKRSDEPKRKGSIKRYTYHIVLLTVFAVALFVALSVTVLFNTEKIVVENNAGYSDKEVIDASGIVMGQNIWTMDTAAAEDSLLNKLPYIDKAEIEKSPFKNTITIKLTKAQAVANVVCDSNYYLISQNGRIMDSELTKPDENYIIVEGFEPEYAQSGDFLSAASERGRNNLVKLLSIVKQYDGIEDEYNGAVEKYEVLFKLLSLIDACGLKDNIISLDISSIYKISLNYEDQIKLELGENIVVEQKLMIAKKLIDNGEFTGEKGTLFLNQVKDASDAVKVTFRPIREANTENPETTTTTTPAPNPAPSDETYEETEPPAEETEATAEETEAPAEETEAPAEETEAPAEETEAPAEETEAPAEETEALAEETEAPAEETEAPAEETEVPAEETEPSYEEETEAQSEEW